MKKIKLTNGKYSLVSDSDFFELSKYKWWRTDRTSNQYAERSFWDKNKKRVRKVLMHRIIMGLKTGDKRQIDHIDGNGLNNQRTNLRICTLQKNQHNRRRQKNNTSGYKNITWVKETKKWRVAIDYNNKTYNLGRYKNKMEAKKVRDIWLLKLHKEFASYN